MKPRKLKLNRFFVLRAARSTYQNRIVLGRENIPLAICISRVLDRESSSHEKSTWRTVKLTINRKFKDQGQAQKTNEANYKGLKVSTWNLLPKIGFHPRFLAFNDHVQFSKRLKKLILKLPHEKINVTSVGLIDFIRVLAARSFICQQLEICGESSVLSDSVCT